MFFLEVDPSVVKPGWTPLIITILLAAAIALLMISMRRQIRKIRVPHREELGDSAAGRPGSSGAGDTGDGRDGSDETAGTDDTTRGGTAGERHPIAHG